MSFTRRVWGYRAALNVGIAAMERRYAPTNSRTFGCGHPVLIPGWQHIGNATSMTTTIDDSVASLERELAGSCWA